MMKAQSLPSDLTGSTRIGLDTQRIFLGRNNAVFKGDVGHGIISWTAIWVKVRSQ
jgi:hypothetical protein